MMHNQVSGRTHTTISTDGVYTPRWDPALKRVDNSRAMILWDFKFQPGKQLLVNQPDILMSDLEQKRAAVIA